MPSIGFCADEHLGRFPMTRGKRMMRYGAGRGWFPVRSVLETDRTKHVDGFCSEGPGAVMRNGTWVKETERQIGLCCAEE